MDTHEFGCFQLVIHIPVANLYSTQLVILVYSI